MYCDTEKTYLTQVPKLAFIPAYRGFVTLLTIAVLSLCIAAQSMANPQPRDKWHWQAAAVRGRVTTRPRRSHTLRIDLPYELQSRIQGVAAYSDDDSPLPASIIKIGGEPVAVEIGPHRQNRFTRQNEPIWTYFSNNKPSPHPVAAESRRPVTLFDKRELLRARPFSYAEFMALENARQPTSFRRSIPDFSLPSTYSRHQNKKMHFRVHRMRASAMLKLEETTKATFAANSRTSAWFMWLNGKPLVSWREHLQDNATDNFCSPVVKLPAGLHRLDFCIVSRYDEPTPQLSWKTGQNSDFTAIPASKLVASVTPHAYQYEWRDKSHTPLLTIEDGRFYDCQSSGREFSAWKFNVAETQKRNWQIHIENRPLVANNYMIFDEFKRPAIQFSTKDKSDSAKLTLPEALAWRASQAIKPGIVPAQVPVTTKANDRIAVTLKIKDLPAVLEESTSISSGSESLILAHQQFSHTEDEPVNGTIKLANPNPHNNHTISFQLAENPSHILVTGHINNIPITAPHRISCLYPENSFNKLEPKGTQLFDSSNPAILVLPSSQASVNPEMNRLKALRQRGLFVVDEFWSKGIGPDRPHTLGQLIEQETGIPAAHAHTGRVGENALDQLKKFGLLNEALASEAAAIVWSVGITDLRAGLTLPEIMRRIRFLTRATLAHGKLPILVTLPAIGQPETDGKTHKLAVAIKQYGLSINIPVVDVYSQAKTTPDIFASFFPVKTAYIPYPQPDNAGRLWFCRLLGYTIKESR